MRSTFRSLGVLLLVSFFAAGCSAEEPATTAGGETKQPAGSSPADAGDASKGKELAGALDACALPKTCAWPTSSGKPEEIDSARCVVSELAAGRAVGVSTVLVADGGPSGCETRRELHFFAATGVAYTLWRNQCAATGEHVLERCTMLDKAAYATCLADIDASRSSPDGVRCASPEDWVKDCTDVEQVACP